MLTDRPFAQLVRHFFTRFFDNDWAPPGTEITTTVTQALALLAVPGLLLPLSFTSRYAYLWHHPSLPAAQLTWNHKYLFITYAMGVMGMLAVLEWDSLFPDLRDFHILTPLPLPRGAMFGAQVGALLLFLLLFSVAVNGPSCFLFPFVAGLPAVAPGGLARFFLGHAVTVFCASWFVFFLVVALEGILLLLLTPRAFRRASPYCQFIALSLLAALFFLYKEVAPYLPSLHHPSLKIMQVLPTMWFLGLYETLLGRQDPLFAELARRALVALAAVTAAAVVSYVLAYRRHARRSLEASPLEEGGPSPLVDLLTRWVNR